MKKFTFVFCKDIKFNWEWWACKVETVDDFKNFMEIRTSALANKYMKLKKKIKNKYHLDWEEHTYRLILSLNDKRKTLVDDISILSDKLLSGYNNYFFFGGKILLVNSVFGFRFLDNSVKVLKTKLSDNYIFPDEVRKVRIIRWKDGKHYYAKIGDVDIVVNGEQKWNSRKEAKRNADIYLKEAKNNI